VCSSKFPDGLASSLVATEYLSFQLLTTHSSIIVGIICSVLTPYMLNPGAWGWSNFTGFFWVSPLQHPLESHQSSTKALTTDVYRVASASSASSTHTSESLSHLDDPSPRWMSYFSGASAHASSLPRKLMCSRKMLTGTSSRFTADTLR
jgi:hypothetical protein